ncbi:MAG: AAA family ATPase [Candidatus Peribacteraceae bacterium]
MKECCKMKNMQTPVSYLREIRTKEMPRDIDEYPFNIPSLREGNFHLSFESPVTFFVGENGSGKSTVLEAIAIGSGFNPGGGSRNTLNNQRRSESILHEHLIFTWKKKVFDGFFLRAESFFNFASFLEEWEQETGEDFHGPYGGKSLHEQSHGESFITLAKNRFKKGLYLLDEPEAALSPLRQLTLLSLMNEYVIQGDSQYIIATHSPIILSYPGATILEFSSNGLKKVAYKDTEHFTVTKDFLNAPEAFLKHLFEK